MATGSPRTKWEVLPSGKHTKNDGKIHHFLAGNVSTISVDLEKYADVFLATNAGELSMNILGV